MAEELGPHTGTQIQRLKAAMRELPQLDLKTSHFFADGMYCRVLPRPAGALIVGKKHKRSHFYIVVTGRVAVVDVASQTRNEYGPGSVIVSAPGAERAVLALEDSVCITVHNVGDMTDLDEIEAALIEHDPTALYDARNRLLEAA
jgi:hypothetical protein